MKTKRKAPASSEIEKKLISFAAEQAEEKGREAKRETGDLRAIP